MKLHLYQSSRHVLFVLFRLCLYLRCADVWLLFFISQIITQTGIRLDNTIYIYTHTRSRDNSFFFLLTFVCLWLIEQYWRWFRIILSKNCSYKKKKQTKNRKSAPQIVTRTIEERTSTTAVATVTINNCTWDETMNKQLNGNEILKLRANQ